MLALFAVAAWASLLAAAPLARAEPVGETQWQLAALNVRTAWQYATGAGVTVAVLDSGVDGGHPDLAGQVLPGADFVNPSMDARQDPVGHGTTVAALIAGHDDDSGVVGLAPAASILPVRVLDAENKYDDAAVVASGLRWAVDHGADVVNLSLGGSTPSDRLADAVRYAEAHDVVVVACTGNVTAGAAKEVWYPAREPGVVAVAGLAAVGAGGSRPTPAAGVGGASSRGAGKEKFWPGSLTGPQTVLTAPAVDLLGARPGGYWRVQGTSFAAPLVTAAATLIRSRWPHMNAANVINRLIRTARDLGPPGRDDQYGFGEVDPVAALTAQVKPVAGNPLDAGPSAADDPREAATQPPLVMTQPPAAGALPQPTDRPDQATGTASEAASAARALRVRSTLRAGLTAFVLLLVTGLSGGWLLARYLSHRRVGYRRVGYRRVRYRHRYRWDRSGSARPTPPSTPRWR